MKVPRGEQGIKDEKIQMSTYLYRSQLEKMEELHHKTRIPKAALYQEAVDDLLKKHNELLEK
jgi:hypothetical protein